MGVTQTAFGAECEAKDGELTIKFEYLSRNLKMALSLLSLQLLVFDDCQSYHCDHNSHMNLAAVMFCVISSMFFHYLNLISKVWPHALY